MPEFFTKVKIPVPDFSIGYHSKLFFLGSCFADNIGRKMKDLKFDVCNNPFGVLYNPVSLANSIKLLLEKKSFQKADLSFFNELWYSYAHYTVFSDVDPDTCLEKINKSFIQALDFIKSADVLFITLGTSWVFKLKNNEQVVANCHKLPSSNFERFFSSIDNSVEHLIDAISKLRNINSAVKIVLTVSPIRHFSDGAILNQRSKAALILTASKLQEEISGIYYFPAYEIFMDELRDYRFYAADMIHPSDLATDYIWDQFAKTLLTDDSKNLASEIQKIIVSIDHRPRHIDTNAYKNFMNATSKKLDALSQQYPFLDFTAEKAKLKI
jgi:hypothetical protein